jgi:methionyl-tRNA synthetase
MLIRKLDRETFTPAFDISCRQIYPAPGIAKTPFNAYWNLVDAGKETKSHRHHEGETFLIARGSGVMTGNGHRHQVEVGDVIFIPPFTEHTLANSSDSEELMFLNIYWEDMKLIFDGAEGGAGGASPLVIRKLDRAAMSSAFDIACQRVYPAEGIAETPFNAFWNLVDAGKETKSHRHHEGETFLVMQGEGVMTGNGESHPVASGDVIFIPPFTEHTLANSSEDEELLFLNIYWEDMKLIFDQGGAEAADAGPASAQEQADGEHQRGGDGPPPAARRHMATSSPPNPNGDLHLGHLSGPNLGADVYSRFRRLQGHQGFYMVGTDDNQIWTASMAEQRGETPQQTADHFAEKIITTLGKMGMEVAEYYRPNANPYNRELTEAVVKKLHAEGHIVARDAPALVDPTDGRYLFEAYVQGTCPHCGAGACGNACEECGMPLACTALLNPKAKLTGATPEVRTVRRLFLPLEPHRERIADYIAKTAMPAHLAAFAQHFMAAPELPEVVASHVADWGIPVPIAGFEGQIVSAWLEMGPGYVAGSWPLADRLTGKSGFAAQSWRHLWASDEADLVQFFGLDNSWNHAILYPLVFQLFDPTIRPPVALVSNHFYKLEGSKFSTSRGHAIWGGEAADRWGADPLRLFLAMTGPEAEQSNFAQARFESFVDDELIGTWQQWLGRLGAKMESLYGGTIPEAGTWRDDHLRFLKRLKGFLDSAAECYEPASFSLRRAARLACELVRSASDFGKREDAWGRSPAGKDERRTAIALELAAARTLALIVGPLMPGFAAKLWAGLGYPEPFGQARWDALPQFVTPYQKVGDLAFEHFTSPTAGDSPKGERVA